jgi:hypothetical protein
LVVIVDVVFVGAPVLKDGKTVSTRTERVLKIYHEQVGITFNVVYPGYWFTFTHGLDKVVYR